MKEWLVLVGDEHASVATVLCDTVRTTNRQVEMYDKMEGIVAVWSLDNIAGVMQADAEAKAPPVGFWPWKNDSSGAAP